jgi:hypothetical protein
MVGPEESSWRLERHDGFLVSVIAHPFDKHREAFGDPGSVCSVVPGWREALVMYDADGLATPLIEEVRAWIWGPLERRCDRWVAEETTGYAEEVHKLAPALRNGNRPLAAVPAFAARGTSGARSSAVHRRILYGSENHLWDLVSGAMGRGGTDCNPPPWAWAMRVSSRPGPPR